MRQYTATVQRGQGPLRTARSIDGQLNRASFSVQYSLLDDHHRCGADRHRLLDSDVGIKLGEAFAQAVEVGRRLEQAAPHRLGDEIIQEFPADITELDRLEPVYEWFEGWRVSTADARSIADLPVAARRYLDRIESLVETPIRFVSVGTRRDQIIDVPPR